MNRREMLGLCGWTMIARAAEEDSRSLVSTPEKRAAYLRQMLRELCTGIGPRPAGSKGYDAGALLIEREMKRAIPSASLDTFTFLGWEPVGNAEFQAGDTKLETYIAENSPATPPEGVRGKLRKNNDGEYEIVDEKGHALARIGISEFGRAIAALHNGSDKVPLFNIGKQDAAMLEQAAQKGLPALAKAQARRILGAKSSNVVGSIGGTSKEEILVVAHADTKYNTPGANDNTASMICLLMLAHASSGSRPRRTLTFLATSGEERGYMGAKHYALTRKEKGTLADVKVCVNLDSLTYGPNLQIATTDHGLERTILDIHRDLGIRSNPKVLSQNDTMDSAPFHAAGGRTVHLNSRGDDARTLPLWHRPEDGADTIKPEFIESSFLILMELISRLMAEPRP